MENLTTKYPVVLVHGMGFRERKGFSYWGRIPAALRRRGCRVYLGNPDANGAVQDNAAALKTQILEILQKTGKEKVNIIGHSKGGLDARYMVSCLDMAERVASVTTVGTPHHGSRTVDKLLRFPPKLVELGCGAVDVFMKCLGDSKPQTHRVIRSFTTAEAEAFNARVPDVPGVYYQSYAFVMAGHTSDALLMLPHMVVKAIEGPNDGLLPPSAVKWGRFRGVFTGNTHRGISHWDEIDFRRRPFSRKQGAGVGDISEFYADVIAELKTRGF